MDRRHFVGLTAVGVAAAGLGLSCSSSDGRKKIPQTHPQNVEVPFGEIRSVLLHLGWNMWCDYPAESMGKTLEERMDLLNYKPNLKLTCTDETWRKATDRAVEKGINMIVIDLGEALYYPSHPELAVEGTWSIEKMRAEIERLNALGVEVVPKLNFSTAHNGWMGDYSHMISSKPYYRMCEDVISDVVEIFGHPRYFHIGMDEETVDKEKRYQYICVRQDELWWHDFYHLIDNIEKHGARAWMWSDYMWDHDDFCDRCPKSVIQQNWMYDSQYGGFDLATNTTRELIRLQSYLKLDEAGFDQVPCSTNWVGGRRLREGIGSDDVIGKFVPFCREHISKEHLMGFMMAPWDSMATPESLEHTLRGIDLFSDAMNA